MKKILLLIFAAAAFYLGGAYRFTPLLVFAAAAALLLPTMFILSRALAKKTEVRFARSEYSAETGGEAAVSVICENGGRLPVTRCRADISAAYPNSKPDKIKLQIGADANSEQTKEIEIKAPCCGLIELKIEKFRVCDWLNIFAAPKKCGAVCRAAVYPKERELDVSLSPSHGMSGFAERTGLGGGTDTEIKDIREYEHGDSARLIHRNRSAKTGELWVKELEKQADIIAELYLDMSGADAAEPRSASLFYEVLSALAAGLLKNAAAVRIFYKSGENRLITARNGEDIRGALLELYQTDPKSLGAAEVPSGGVSLGLDCRLSRDGKTIKKFTSDDFDAESGVLEI